MEKITYVCDFCKYESQNSRDFAFLSHPIYFSANYSEEKLTLTLTSTYGYTHLCYKCFSKLLKAIAELIEKDKKVGGNILDWDTFVKGV